MNEIDDEILYDLENNIFTKYAHYDPQQNIPIGLCDDNPLLGNLNVEQSKKYSSICRNDPYKDRPVVGWDDNKMKWVEENRSFESPILDIIYAVNWKNKCGLLIEGEITVKQMVESNKYFIKKGRFGSHEIVNNNDKNNDDNKSNDMNKIRVRSTLKENSKKSQRQKPRRLVTYIDLPKSEKIKKSITQLNEENENDDEICFIPNRKRRRYHAVNLVYNKIDETSSRKKQRI